ncbi:MAG: hypothetical protein ACXWDN_20705 [Limisphaerales bacterium]
MKSKKNGAKQTSEGRRKRRKPADVAQDAVAAMNEYYDRRAEHYDSSMGYDNPRAAKGVHPFENCDNHLLLAEEAGLGTADLSKIDVRGVPIAKAVYRYG